MPAARPPRAQLQSIAALLRTLVRLPSRAGEDDPRPIVEAIERWMRDHALPCRRLSGADGAPLALYAEVRSRAPGPWVVLDATLDTAGFGALDAWRHPPTAAAIEDGWLIGRGAADSKAGAALFCHLLLHFSAPAPAPAWAGRLGLLLDLDEHSGGFGGARAFFEAPDAPRPDGVFIGYPGLDRLMVGARGFVRALVSVPGVAAHAGASSQRGLNAVLRAARLALALEEAGPDLGAADASFPRPAQLTVTALRGGQGFSQVPDRCELALDLRLTPGFDAPAARAAVAAVLRSHDVPYPAGLHSAVTWLPGWPAYRLPDGHPLVAALREGAGAVLGREPPLAVAGPSNIGNYLASLGVPALCGFGPSGRGLHAANEAVELASIAPAFQAYALALRRLLGSA